MSRINFTDDQLRELVASSLSSAELVESQAYQALSNNLIEGAERDLLTCDLTGIAGAGNAIAAIYRWRSAQYVKEAPASRVSQAEDAMKELDKRKMRVEQPIPQGRTGRKPR